MALSHAVLLVWEGVPLLSPPPPNKDIGWDPCITVLMGGGVQIQRGTWEGGGQRKGGDMGGDGEGGDGGVGDMGGQIEGVDMGRGGDMGGKWGGR